MASEVANPPPTAARVARLPVAPGIADALVTRRVRSEMLTPATLRPGPLALAVPGLLAWPAPEFAEVSQSWDEGARRAAAAAVPWAAWRRPDPVAPAATTAGPPAPRATPLAPSISVPVPAADRRQRRPSAGPDTVTFSPRPREDLAATPTAPARATSAASARAPRPDPAPAPPPSSPSAGGVSEPLVAAADLIRAGGRSSPVPVSLTGAAESRATSPVPTLPASAGAPVTSVLPTPVATSPMPPERAGVQGSRSADEPSLGIETILRSPAAATSQALSPSRLGALAGRAAMVRASRGWDLPGTLGSSQVNTLTGAPSVP